MTESPDVRGLMFIGDPHLEARIPGFRRDDYPQVALQKFRWCLQQAQERELQPVLLGDLFQLPQDNPNWLVAAIIESIPTPLPAIYGNHDVRENSLKPNDTARILFSGGHLRRLSADEPWVGHVGGKKVTVGGTVWGERLPREYEITEADHALTVWVTHHDILIPGYEESGRIRPRDVPGIDLIVNGHVHRRLDPVCKGDTHWVTAGNITRRSRSDASRAHVPAVPCLVPAGSSHSGDIVHTYRFCSRRGDAWELRWLQVPHQPFDTVFHAELTQEEEATETGSGFIADLRELTARRTDSGAGLTEFLNQHLDQFPPVVSQEIRRLATEVTTETTTNR